MTLTADSTVVPLSLGSDKSVMVCVYTNTCIIHKSISYVWNYLTGDSAQNSREAALITTVDVWSIPSSCLLPS